MNVFKKLDRFFDTFEKREALLKSLLGAYWLWQLIWLFAFFYALSSIDDYSSLFGFLGKMERYDPSLFVRVLLSIVTQAGSWHLVWTKIEGLDLICILFSFLFVQKDRWRQWLGPFWIIFLFCLWVMINLYWGFEASSLDVVIQILHRMSIGALFLTILLIFWTLYRWIIYFYRYFSL